MALLAIYMGRVFRLGDDLNKCRLLDCETHAEVMCVAYGDPELLVDPTDAQIEAVEKGDPIPPESCAVCHGNPMHERDWNYRTLDGYGVCDQCGERAARIIKIRERRP
jgi:hypothetical protein